MDYQQTLNKIELLEAKEQELFELIVVFDDNPVQRAEYIHELADYATRRKKLENLLLD